ncbi:EAL domain-containing protein [Clostridium cavendishii]|nr:EAL domain-containing protein [Clostridium cavendishii]
MFISIDKNKRIYFLLLIIISLLAIVCNIHSINFILGLNVSLTTIFLFIILRMYGLKKAVPVAIIAHIIAILNEKVYAWDAVFIIEIIFIGLWFKYKSNKQLIFSDSMFWVFIGLPVQFLLYKVFLNNIDNKLLYFNLFFYFINSLMNAFISDIIYTYIPLKNFMSREKNYYIEFKQFITHILILAVIVPFLINGASTLEGTNNNINSDVYRISENISTELEADLKLWSSEKIDKLILLGTVETGYLDNLIYKNIKNEECEVTVLNKSNIIISTNSKVMNKRQKINKYDRNNTTKESISDNFYRVIPNKLGKSIAIQKWLSGYYVYEEFNKELGIKIIVRFPINKFQDEFWEDIVYQFELLMIFSICLITSGIAINRVVIKTLANLAQNTTDLPNKILNNQDIKLPQSNILELRSLIDNFNHMSKKLNEMFKKSYELNIKLEEKTDMLTKSHETLEKLAYYDILTGLPNRLSFQMFLEENTRKNKEKQIAVIFMDIDSFKNINDNLGHSSGDELLEQIAKRLKKTVDEKKQVFRLGGDEFVIVLLETDFEEATIKANEIMGIFEEDFILDGTRFNVTGSAGVSYYPHDGNDVEEITKKADLAMYEAKASGKNKLKFFNDDINKKFIDHISIKNNIGLAVERNEFQLYYQPKINTKTLKITGAEALIRWFSKDLGFVAPDKFIPILEESGEIFEIDRWVLREACRQNKLWQESNIAIVPISINISAKHFYKENLFKLVKEVLEETKLESKYLKLEITESVLIENVDTVISVINQLRSIGVLVSIDDFGKGFSSLNQLLKLPVNEVKIDKEFITDITVNKKRQNVISLIIGLAHSLDLNVVAEGIETREEFEYLLKIACDDIQGYYFSKPLPKNDFERYLEK